MRLLLAFQVNYRSPCWIIKNHVDQPMRHHQQNLGLGTEPELTNLTTKKTRGVARAFN